MMCLRTCVCVRVCAPECASVSQESRESEANFRVAKLGKWDPQLHLLETLQFDGHWVLITTVISPVLP